ncbi:uncharacterized protein LOC134132812 isoform X2 [Pungitius pungitius]|uniref:uncharacterized protein LOC134132812 isoform X2 n=1 Tax=Pungitius pungitius TaxID=134920 RepID=UPI002E115836
MYGLSFCVVGQIKNKSHCLSSTHRNDGETPVGSASGPPTVNGTTAGPKNDEDIILLSDAESESLLLPASALSQSKPSLYPSVVLLRTKVEPEQQSVEGSSPDRGSSGGSSPPRHSEPLYVPRTAAVTNSPVDTAGLLLTSACPTLAPPSSLKPGFDSTSFWKSCNAAGCTQVLFTGFLNEMNEICSRIQSDRASREDYDHALTVMTASGKLPALVAKQQEELQKATAAMKVVASALRM